MAESVSYENSFNNEYSFHFWGEQDLEDMLAIIDHMTRGDRIDRNETDSEEAED